MNHKLEEEEEDIHKKYIYNCDNGRAQPYFKSPCHWAQIHAGAVFFKKKNNIEILFLYIQKLIFDN